MLTPFQLFGVLREYAYPGAVDLNMNNGVCCFNVDGIALCYTHNVWIVFGRVIPNELPDSSTIYADQVHTEIRRVSALFTNETDRRRDVEHALVEMTAERDSALTKCAERERQLDAMKRERHKDSVRQGEKIQDRDRRIRVLEEQRRAAMTVLESKT